MLVTMVCSRRQNFCLLGLYRNPNIDGHIFDRLLASVVCTQIVEKPTHIAGGRLDLVLTDVQDLVRVSTHCLIGTSDHFHLQVVVMLNERVPQMCCTRRVLLKSRINWGAVRDDLAVLP